GAVARRYERELRSGIEEVPDQPGARDSIRLRALSRHPLHAPNCRPPSPVRTSPQTTSGGFPMASRGRRAKLGAARPEWRCKMAQIAAPDTRSKRVSAPAAAPGSAWFGLMVATWSTFV